MPKCVLESSEVQKIYFVGIKGVGMTALALIAKEAGMIVSGADVSEEFLTDEILSKNNIVIDSGFDPSFLDSFIKDAAPSKVLVITTAAHDGLDNALCRHAKSLGIQVITHGQAVGLFMEGSIFKRSFCGVSVLGCHGKTTVTAMCATALTKAGMDPSYAVGTSELFPLGNPGHLGEGEHFIAEADEFISDIKHDRTVKFLYQYPQIAIINNIDFDHPDVYKDLEEVYQVFLQFVSQNIQENGTLIINGDDKNCVRLKEELESIRKDLQIITFGESPSVMVRSQELQENGWGSEFEIFTDGENMGKQRVNVPGLHNAKNSLVVAALLWVAKKTDNLQSAISAYTGSKRRQEKIGETKNGAIVIDDYAHHPEEIKKTISAVGSAYKDRKIVAIFQPHTVGRTASLVNEFSASFADAEEIVFLPIFSSKREGSLDYSQIYSEIEEEMKKNSLSVAFLKDERTSLEMEDSPYSLKKYRSIVVKYILEKFDSSHYVILTLGAGDVYKIAYDLIEK